MTTRAQRIKLAAVMDLLVEHEPQIHYPPGDVRHWTVHQIASLAHLNAILKSGDGLTMDCSQSIELICRLAGLRDPNGYRYRRDGFTGSMLDHLKPHYTRPSASAIGAIVIFGPGTGDHGCMVRRGGLRNPRLFSHGQERGPLYTTLDVEAAYHRPPVTFLSIASL